MKIFALAWLCAGLSACASSPTATSNLQSQPVLSATRAALKAPGPPSVASGPAIPYNLEVLEVAGSTLPALQSYSSAHAQGKWLVLGGRSAGLHGFGPGTNNFPRSTANTMAYVIDPSSNGVLGSVDLVANLPANLSGPLTASNPEFVQVGSQLVVLGGYGKDLASGKMTTFGSIISIDVDGLVSAIIAKNTKIAGYFLQNASPDNRVRVTGGGLKYNSGIFYLVFGQNFTGDYSIKNGDYNKAGGQFQQYTEKVRAFTLGNGLAIKDFNQVDGGYDPSLPYHRRDLNAVDIIRGDGQTPGAMVYGGVFKAGQVAGHTLPIDVGYSSNVASVTVALQAGFNQALSQYDCAHLTVFDAASKSSFTTLLGGISQYHYDASSGQLVLDALNLSVGIDGLPFINTVSTVQHKPDSSFAQFIQPSALPGLLGAEAQFLHSLTLTTGAGGQLFDNGVINLPALTGRTLVGYVYGGIESFGPYSTFGNPPPGSRASGRFFQVYVTPGATAVLPMPPLPTNPTPYPPSLPLTTQPLDTKP